MPVNIDDIKKLPAEEKLRIIDEIWESIEEGWEKDDAGKEPSELVTLLEERLEQYEKGETKSYSWDEVEEMVKKNLEQQRNEKK
jgi:putative addiction module component (TIGR02574 family)